MNNYILSIAIPTYNRAIYLDRALELLLPQVEQFSKVIEIVISNNASEDNTIKVVEKYIKKYKTLNIFLFNQEENTGYYGNFRKCRELAHGSFFWLLSDNDYVIDGALACIIEILKKRNVDLVYLHDRTSKNISVSYQKHSVRYHSTDEFFYKNTYRPTLISSIIMANRKSDDAYLFKTYSGNTLLGFILALFAINEKSSIAEIRGNTLLCDANAKFSFDVFESWTKDFKACIDIINEHKLVSVHTEKIIINSLIKDTIRSHVILFRIKKQNYIHINKDISAAKNLLWAYYGNYWTFRVLVLPFLYLPLFVVRAYYFFVRTTRILSSNYRRVKNLN